MQRKKMSFFKPTAGLEYIFHGQPGAQKRAAREGRPGSYRMKLSNNHEIAVSSSPILWTPSRIRLRISGRGFLQPEA